MARIAITLYQKGIYVNREVVDPAAFRGIFRLSQVSG